jgi:hypothetical protein
MPERSVLFGASLGQWNGADTGNVAGVLELAATADREGLDLFTIAAAAVGRDPAEITDVYNVGGRITSFPPFAKRSPLDARAPREAHIVYRSYFREDIFSGVNFV